MADPSPLPQELRWKERATESIRRLPVLQGQLQTLEEQLREKDDELLHLRNLPRGEPPPTGGLLSRRNVVGTVGVATVFALAAALFLVWDEVPPPV